MKLTDKINVTFNSIQIPLNTAYLCLDDFIVDLSRSTSFFKLKNKAADYVGSSEGWLNMDWSDTILFNKDNLQFEALCFHIPETNVELDNILEFENRAKLDKAQIILKQNENFVLSPMSYRYYIEKEDLLICFNQFNLSLAGVSEFKIANNLSLFEQKGSYIGWGMHSPHQYLNFKLSSKQKSKDSFFLKETFQKFLSLIETKNFEKMEQKNLDVLKQLAKLHNEISTSVEAEENIALKSIKEWIFDISDRYYWGTDYESYFINNE